MARTYGHALVSSIGQNEDRQLLARGKMDIPASRIFLDRQSGKDFQRPQYQAMLKKLRPGDLLRMPSLDRLGRNYEEIRRQWHL